MNEFNSFYYFHIKKIVLSTKQGFQFLFIKIIKRFFKKKKEKKKNHITIFF